MNVGTKADADGNPIDGTGLLAPSVGALGDAADPRALNRYAGAGKEDRLMAGSYVQLRVRGKAHQVEAR